MNLRKLLARSAGLVTLVTGLTLASAGASHAATSTDALPATPASSAPSAATPYCVAQAQSSADAPSSPIQACFTDYGKSINYATRGAVLLTSHEYVPLAATTSFAPAITTVIAQDFRDYNFGGAVLTVTVNGDCNSGRTYGFTSMPSGWDDDIGSVKTYANCGSALFEDVGYGQAKYVTSRNSSSSSLGALNDRGSSQFFAYNV